MKRPHVIAYSTLLSLASFVAAVFVGSLAREARLTIWEMIGDKPIPWFTSLGLNAVPIFCAFGVFYLALAATCAARPCSTLRLSHAFVITLIFEAALMFLCTWGIAVFFATLDHALLGIPR